MASPSPTPLQITLVEDSDADAELLEIFLRQEEPSWPFALERCRDLPKGPEVLSQTPDIVLLDLNLPSSRGLETVARFRERFPEVPLIVLTGLGDYDMARQALRAGAQDYFEKDRLSTLPLQRLIRFAIERFDTQREMQHLNTTLESQRNQLNDILESTSDGIIAVDSASVVRFANSAALRLMGRKEAETVGHPFFLPNLLQKSKRQLRFDLGGGAARELEIKTTEATWRDEPYHLITISDITETKIYQDMLIQTERQNLVDQLAAAIAHEFNNALAIIRMTVELLLAHEVSAEERREHLEILLGEVERSLSLVNKLTSLSREDDPALEVTDLRAFLEEHRTIYSKTLGGACELSFAFDDPHPQIEADANQLHQIFINLLVNASHAMPNGGKTKIRLSPFNPVDRQEESTAPHGYVQVEVSDSGTGMDNATRERIFEPFFTTKPKGQGTGLGLALVSSIIHHHRGWIECDSSPESGTTFRMFLPRSLAEAPAEGRQASRPWRTPPAKIAVVDDNELLLNLLQELLRGVGHDVRGFPHPQPLVEATQQGYAPEVLLSDMVMPEMSGLSLVDLLRERLPALKCAIMSGYNLDGVRAQIPQEKAIFLISKPFTNEKLFSTLFEMLGPAEM